MGKTNSTKKARKTREEDDDIILTWANSKIKTRNDFVNYAMELVGADNSNKHQMSFFQEAAGKFKVAVLRELAISATTALQEKQSSIEDIQDLAEVDMPFPTFTEEQQENKSLQRCFSTFVNPVTRKKVVMQSLPFPDCPSKEDEEDEEDQEDDHAGTKRKESPSDPKQKEWQLNFEFKSVDEGLRHSVMERQDAEGDGDCLIRSAWLALYDDDAYWESLAEKEEAFKTKPTSEDDFVALVRKQVADLVAESLRENPDRVNYFVDPMSFDEASGEENSFVAWLCTILCESIGSETEDAEAKEQAIKLLVSLFSNTGRVDVSSIVSIEVSVNVSTHTIHRLSLFMTAFRR